MMGEMLDVEAIRHANPLPAIVAATVKLERAGAEWKACCPFHQDRSPSFTIFAGGARFHCFGCGAGGDVLDYVQLAHGVRLREAADMLGGGALPTVEIERATQAQKQSRVEEARAIWRNAAAAHGTLAERYLVARRLSLVPASIRFARLPYGVRGPLLPSLIACVASVENCLIGIQRTYLNAQGTWKADVPKPKLSLGRVTGGAIRCAPAGEHLIVTEGLEDALTLQQEYRLPAWAAAGAGMLRRLQLPPVVRAVTIGSDNDAAGQAAAEEAAERFRGEGRDVRIIRPDPAHKDFNDALRARL